MRHRQDAKLYYSISEASAIAKVKPHVLRYWETQFKMLRPKKNKAGNRMYRKRDLRLIQIIKELLYDKGFTISGARRKLLDERAQLREQLDLPFSEGDRAALLAEIKRDLEEVLLELKGLSLSGTDPADGGVDLEEAGELEEAVDLDESADLEEGSGRDGAIGLEEAAGRAGAAFDERGSRSGPTNGIGSAPHEHDADDDDDLVDSTDLDGAAKLDGPL